MNMPSASFTFHPKRSRMITTPDPWQEPVPLGTPLRAFELAFASICLDLRPLSHRVPETANTACKFLLVPAGGGSFPTTSGFVTAALLIVWRAPQRRTSSM